MNKNIKAGADIHAGDGGYSEGTQEQYDAFVKVRNKSLAQGRIRQLAEQAGLKHHNWITNESNVKDGDFKYPRLEDYEKFAELIVRECAELCHMMAEDSDSYVVHDGDTCARQIKKHFGVAEREE